MSVLARIKERFGLDELVFDDFETYYKTKGTAGNKSFSLRTLTYAQYIFDERFHTTGMGIGYDDQPISFVHVPEEIRGEIERLKAKRAEGIRIGLVAANTGFDGAILAWRFGLVFDFYFDVLAMRKLLYGAKSASLKQAALDEWPDDEELHKGGDELVAVDGVAYQYMEEHHLLPLGKYCAQDTNLARRLLEVYFERIERDGLIDEIFLMHITLRAAIEPQFVVDHKPLVERIAIEKDKKKTLFQKAVQFLDENFNITDVTAKTFSSNQQFADLLECLSVRVPTKKSKTTGKDTPALGKNDPEYVRMRIDYDHLAPIFDARESSKSSNALTRAESFIDVSNAFDKHCALNIEANMPFFLNYCGAGQTGRWSGGQKLNQQNLEADRTGKGEQGHHRRSLRAPEGYQVAVCDLSNIELRVNMWLCGQQDVLDQMEFEEGYDYYCDVAGGIFDRIIVKSEDKQERQMGKASGLGLGFAMGWRGFQGYLASGPMGMDPMFKDDSFCRKVKASYDAKHPMIVQMWEYIDKIVIPVIVNGGETLQFGPDCSIIAEKDRIVLPSGRVLHYPNARWSGKEGRGGFNFRAIIDGPFTDRFGRAVPKSLWHGLILENMVQAIARDVLGYQKVGVYHMLEIDNDYGWLIGSVHDETLSMIRTEVADIAFDAIQSIMKVPPPWARTLPLDCEGGYAPEYSK